MSIRSYFKRRPYKDIKKSPLWHRYQSHTIIQGDGKKQLMVEAACGYSYTVDSFLASDGIGFSAFEWKDEVKTDSRRCSKCDKKAGL